MTVNAEYAVQVWDIARKEWRTLSPKTTPAAYEQQSEYLERVQSAYPNTKYRLVTRFVTDWQEMPPALDESFEG